MSELLIFLNENPFMPHGHCYLWKPGLVGLHVISDAAIALAYYSIPIALLYFVRKRPDLPFNWMFLLFGAFIIACGTTHIAEVWTLWYPTYWLSGFLKAITAGISVYTAVALLPLLPQALALPSPAQLEAANLELKREIATRKMAEQELRMSSEALHTSEAQMRALFTAMTDAIMVLDARGRYLQIPPTNPNLLYKPPTELIGKTLHEVFPPEPAEFFLTYINKALSSKLPVNVEYSLLIGDIIVWFAACVSPVTEDSVIWVARDITLRKQAENARTQAYAELELRVRSRTAQLQNTVAQLEQAQVELHKALEKEKELGELKSRFVTMASHEFRTPLATILSSAEVIKYFGNKISEDKKLKHLNKIHTQVKHMTMLLEDVLYIGKAESGGIEALRKPLNLEAFTREIVDEVLQTDKNKHELALECYGNCSRVEMDEKLLRTIITNLLTNALKYSPKEGKVQVNIICDYEKTIINVQDQGIGIPVSEHPKLFENFHRASNVGTISGTGLGLAIVKQAVELLGGKITFDSQVSVGTTFTVCLPNNCRVAEKVD